MHRKSNRLARVQRQEGRYAHSHVPCASRKPLVLALTAALGVQALPGVSIAACFISAPGEVTCNGDLLPGVVSGVTQLTDGQTLNSAIWPVLTVGNLSRPLITLSLAAPLIRFGPDNPVNLNVPGRDLALTFSGPADAPGSLFALFAGGDNVGGIEVRAVSGDGSKGNDASCGIPGYSADYGKAGAPGPAVTLTSGAAIRTLGASAVALRGSSKGGNGGSGGDSCISHSTGSSGAGAVGGTVNVETTTGSVLVTDGAQSHAVFALSEGGAGGRGATGAGAGRYGASGGFGGDGGLVEVRGTATIETKGASAHGIYAVSKGGDGGNGGDGSQGGGAGETGGSGGNVSVSGSWNIVTRGVGAYGIAAYSISGAAGSGGNGGLPFTDPGRGGNSAVSGNVMVDSSGTIDTYNRDAHGIMAASIAGHAGNGGVSNGGFVSFGADGGSAGKGGSVDVTNRGAIHTRGDRASAIFAESVGGGGGNGGSGFSAFYTSGGGGSAGGDGGTVQVTNTGDLRAEGANSRGIFAQSVGGAGGDGGGSVGLVALGGSGANTSNGGKVTVINSGSITTGAPRAPIDVSTLPAGFDPQCLVGCAHAIFAQSVGGGGGNGGTSGGLFSIGGTGGKGGNADEVSVTNHGSLSTSTADSSAIFAQSVGGGGGNGGGSISTSAVGAITIGGNGGDGGDGKKVTVSSDTGLIRTGNSEDNPDLRASRSMGIFAQSVGGGGGTGGFAIALSGGTTFAGSLALGGHAGNGGNAGSVTVVNGSQIETGAIDSHGILAQSVGGGGGRGGFAIAGAASGGGSASLAIGGDGGKGGGSDDVRVANTGNIETFGDVLARVGRSYGILAQSIGGGGGDGGFSVAASFGTGTTKAFSIGGSGEGGGDAGMAVLNSSGNVTTWGSESHALAAQSVGGGGGTGGFSVAGSVSGGGALNVSYGGGGGKGGNASAVYVGMPVGGPADGPITGNLYTHGDRSFGLLAQSAGGGGGDGGFSVAGSVSVGLGMNFSVGGAGGMGALGSGILLNSLANITTEGSHSHAIVAESLGGSGGSGGFSVAGGITVSGGAALNVSIGGNGGTGGHAGTVIAAIGGNIVTRGDHAFGVLAQSVGGGGGDGGFSVGGGIASGANINLSMGGSGGAAGEGFVARLILLEGGIINTSGEESHGAVAQSVGGGGGAGGFSVAGGVSACGLSLGASVGGSGGAGGRANTVTLYSNANTEIETKGKRAYGLLAQSVGGGGGDGGFSISGNISPNVGLGFSLGGGAGPASDGGRVSLDSSTTVRTRGAESHGLFGQSVGGGGGSGDFSVAGSIAQSGTASLSVGGSGATGGNAGDVTVAARADSRSITTEGKRAYGIFAQSVGGSGGDGGFSVAGALTQGAAISFSMGGTAGNGGTSGKVTLTAETNVATSGDGAHGLFAQSLGGGGGSGGFGAAGGVTLNSSETGSLSLAIGGRAGDGSHSGEVSVTTAAGDVISTRGENAFGVLAQSVGGGGGNGGFSATGSAGANASTNMSLSVGGGGGSGNYAGTVFVDNAADIRTSGQGGIGAYLQSVGGSGGNGGLSVATVLGAGGQNTDISVSVGGAGGDGNYASAVTFHNASGANILTRGDDAHGVFAQSVGGGGGSGGTSLTSSVVLGARGSGTNTVLGIAVGGRGGDGSFGGNVGVTNDGSIETFGSSAYGVWAQSVGGGGGSGGGARSLSLLLDRPVGDGNQDNKNLNLAVGGQGAVASDGGTVTVNNNGSITTWGSYSHAIYAHSIGGGGGEGGAAWQGLPLGIPTLGINQVKLYKDVSIVIGGLAGSAGNGKLVTVDSTGTLTTHGTGAHAIFAQSIGGGGGSGGAGVGGLAGRIAVGGGAGSAGNGGDVAVTSSAAINTFGPSAFGILAQSVGGGGGAGGNLNRGLLGFGIGTGYAQSGGASGDGGIVTVTNRASITTQGPNSIALFAQSVAGGGGLVGDVREPGAGGAAGGIGNGIGFAGSTGGRGNAQTVTVIHSGTIETNGERAHGIVAQSAAGQGLGRDVTIALSGDVTAYGASSDGILAQSRGDAGRGNVTIDITSGTVTGGTGESAGVRILEGANNVVMNRGVIRSQGGVQGAAIVTAGGNLAVENHGVITGSIDLGGASNGLHNAQTAVLNSGAKVRLGAGNTLQNDGLLAPGGVGSIATTTVTGVLTQSTTGRLAIDLDAAQGTADRIVATGGANLLGKVELNTLNPGYAPSGTRVVPLVTGGAAVSAAALTLVTQPSATTSYQLVQTSANDLSLQATTNYAAPSGTTLDKNQGSLAEYLNAASSNGAPASLAPLTAALSGITDSAQLKTAYDHLSPAPYTQLGTAVQNSNQRFGSAMLSCRVREGEFRFVQEGDCGWGRVLGRHTTSSGGANNPGYTEDVGEISVGVQKAINQTWYAGFALSYEDSRLDAEDLSRSDGSRYQVGAILKGVYGPTTLSLAFSGGYGHYDTTRNVDVPTPGTIASGSQDIGLAAARLRLGYAFQHTDWYVRPMIDAGITYTRLGGFQEAGAGAANLNVEASNHTYVTVQPAVEVGWEFRQANGTLLRPFVVGSVTQYLSGSSAQITASFQGAPAGVQPFRISTDMDKTYAEINLGLDIIGIDGKDVRLTYIGQFSEHTTSHAAALKFSVPF
jgi:uncharacterized protein YhjY with autotransporter beta-barrel domain